MTTIPIHAKSFKVDVKNNIIVYETGISGAPGLLVLSDETGEKDMILTNQIHNGGLITLKMKPVKYPGAKKFEVGEKIASLIVF